jgi:hypothetical protein
VLAIRTRSFITRSCSAGSVATTRSRSLNSSIESVRNDPPAATPTIRSSCSSVASAELRKFRCGPGRDWGSPNMRAEFTHAEQTVRGEIPVF